ncbi:MAG TPA: ribosome biogenesis GTPase Der [Patescibacteria group bacterium]
MNNEHRPIIALVGRPNVGKSTLFNRLIGRREAITSFIAGTTRDRNFGVAEWFGNSWSIVDTAGVLFEDEEDEIEQAQLQTAMEEQVALAIEEATLVALVVDVKEGLHPTEKKLINELRKHNKPIVVLANKSDNAAISTQADVFHELGIDTLFAVSGIHGSGVGEFVDYLIENYPYEGSDESRGLPRVTFIGRPNVGKSSLLNRILGEDRAVVSPVAGTTRDNVKEEATLPNGQKFMFIDTAGIRRRGSIEAGIEKFSLFRTIRAINQSDIVVVVLTIEERPTRGDAHVVMYALEANKDVILVLNKIDRAQQNIMRLSTNERKRLGEKFLRRFVFMQRLPYYFISALDGSGTKEFVNVLTEAIKKHTKSTDFAPQNAEVDEIEE